MSFSSLGLFCVFFRRFLGRLVLSASDKPAKLVQIYFPRRCFCIWSCLFLLIISTIASLVPTTPSTSPYLLEVNTPIAQVCMHPWKAMISSANGIYCGLCCLSALNVSFDVRGED